MRIRAHRLAWLMIGIAGCLSLTGLGGCSKNTTTGRMQLSGLSRQDEMSLGASEAPKLTSEMGGEVKNPELRDYVTEIGLKLKAQTEEDGPQRQWTFILLDSDVINAFALPGEKVFLSQGLADKFTTEAQMAGVLGHEIGHVMARHTSERIAQAQIGQGLLTVGGIFAGGVQGGDLAVQGGQLLVGGSLLKFSRDQESEADSLGMRYMVKAFYNPRGQLQVMEILKQASEGGSQVELLATHPLPATRIECVQKELQTTYAFTQTGPEASKYQDFAERFQQRYLSVRARESGATPPAPKPKQGKKKTAELPIDDHGRARTLAAVVLEDPTTWCAICMWNAQHASSTPADTESPPPK